VAETLDGVDTARVVLQQPDEGWSREAYDRELETYVETHGRPPQTITMHPETMAALGLSADLQESPLLIASSEYDPATITLYY
jgi:hypothetical protein